MKPVFADVLTVYFYGLSEKLKVGRLAFKDRKILFEYDADFLATGILLSPFKLPLVSGVQISSDKVFDGLFGVFNDSLPDGWGRLLLDRRVEKNGLGRGQLTAFDRLAYVGANGMGALGYEPEITVDDEIKGALSLSSLAQVADQVLSGECGDVFEDLFILNGSSGGARPKIVASVSKDKKKIIHGEAADYEPWLIKFPSRFDVDDIAQVEYAYSLMAKDAGILMPETHLFEGKYFGIKRFDREGERRVHMHSLSGLIHDDYTRPGLDYDTVLKVTQLLTKNMPEVERAFALACFNVLAHNRDDHSKNIAYVLQGRDDWRLSLGYDLTFSYGPGGEQTMTVMGEGKNPGISQLRELGAKYGLKSAETIVERVISAVQNWPQYADRAGLPNKTASQIGKFLER